MSLSVGIVGLPNVGKSTLFNAITLSKVEAANYPFATIDPNKGVVRVNDRRVQVLADFFKPMKTIYATIEFNDIAGLVRGASKGEGLGNKFLSHIRECDAIIQVVRCYEDTNITHVENTVDAKRDIETVNLELIFKDLETLVTRKGKVENKAKANKDKDAMYELEILNILIPELEREVPARLVKTLTKEQQEFVVKSYALLTMKPVIYIANIADSEYRNYKDNVHYQAVEKIAKAEHAQVVPISAAIEAEISVLSAEEKKLYIEELGMDEVGLDKIVSAAYNLLGLKTFFTVGTDEVKAWTFNEGMKAPQCAGTIHSDFERGFIKADVYHYLDFVKFGSEQTLREQGKIRSEGKEYVMKDGDIVFFKFNVKK